jgi:hypothetical protein
MSTSKKVRVPVEPTDAIIAAGVHASNHYPAVPPGSSVEPVHPFIVTCMWRAMVKAATEKEIANSSQSATDETG